MAVVAPVFTGFQPEAIQFLADLAANNDRAWFQPRKGEYERLLKEPLEALHRALGEQFEARGIPLRADPARSPFRIYRDVRFSKDKSPYKTNLGASFPWIGEGPSDGVGRSHDGNVHSSGGYFHLRRARSMSAAGSGIRRSRGSTRSGGGSSTSRPKSRRWSTPPAFREDIRHIERRGPRRSSASRRASRRITPQADILKLKDVVFGRRLPDDGGDVAGAAGPHRRHVRRPRCRSCATSRRSADRAAPVRDQSSVK